LTSIFGLIFRIDWRDWLLYHPSDYG